ncbi:MAG: peptidylprolyl isomerase [Acidobacteriaceae bacterium]
MTEKLTRIKLHGRFPTAASIVVTLALSAVVPTGPAASAQSQPQQGGYPSTGANFEPASNLTLLPLPTPTPITPGGTVVEDAIARINDQVITRTEYEAAEEQLLQQARQDNISQAELDDRVDNLLRDMIDEQLLLSKGKELGITADAETMRELDDIRKRNNLPSMEALEKAATEQGVSFEDFKQHIREQLIRQQVVRDQVGSRLDMTHADEVAYYDAHKQDFLVPEEVHLSEILIPTPDNPTQAQIDSAQARADEISAKLKAGGNFAALARQYSGGPTASAGGDLGDFKRGTLGDVLENATFPLPVGGNTAPIRTRQGYVILHIDSHQKAGIPPLSAVEEKVQEALYFQQLQPALRAYLTKLRSEAYIQIAPGFEDTGAPVEKPTMEIAYTAYTTPALKKKVLKKQRLEQEKANRAQQELKAARDRLAQKEAERAAKAEEKSGKKVDVNFKLHKVEREKIRFGQAPEKALPSSSTQTAASGSTSSGTSGEAPGQALASDLTDSTITTGSGEEDQGYVDPFAPKVVPHKKFRYTDLEAEAEEKKAKKEVAEAETRAQMRPVIATTQQSASEKLQSAPLGLAGDTVKKKKAPRHKRKKNEVKERMREKPQAKTQAQPAAVAPTVNPDLAAPIAPTSPASSSSATQ